mgnify:CR=1 FL=1
MFDPMGQGERLQYPDGEGESVFGPGPTYPSTKEHNAMDRQMALTGDWIGRWFAWDGIRALDVLLHQEEVDPGRIGVTGVSGGGTMTAYAVACDSRVTMSAPCCWVTNWYHNGINEEPQDAEQCPPGVLAAGLEQSDLLLARAPNPVILLTEEQDFFDQRGALLDLPDRNGPPDYRILRPWNDRGYARPNANQFVLETEPEYGAQAVVTKLEDERRTSRPLPGDGPALLYVPHISSDGELWEDGRIRRLEAENPTFFACDYRGVGESRPDTCRPGSFFHMYGSDYHYASYATMLGDSYVSWRVHDVLCTLDWMASFGYDRVHLVAQGWGTVPGALAALLEERVRQVTLIHAPLSYSILAEAPMQEWPHSAMLPGVLREFDLPDLYRELERKDLRMIEPWDADMGSMSRPT